MSDSGSTRSRSRSSARNPSSTGGSSPSGGAPPMPPVWCPGAIGGIAVTRRGDKAARSARSSAAVLRRGGERPTAEASSSEPARRSACCRSACGMRSRPCPLRSARMASPSARSAAVPRKGMAGRSRRAGPPTRASVSRCGSGCRWSEGCPRPGSAAGHAPVPDGARVDQGRVHSPGDMRCDPRSPQVGNLCQIISLVGAPRRAPGRAGGVTVDHGHRRPPHGAATGACEIRLDDHPAAVFDEGMRQSAAPVPGDVLEGLASSSVMCPNWPEE